MRLVDLSHTVSDGLITYPGLPGPVISEHLTFDASHAVYDEGTEFSIGRIEMVSNTGTYLDTPGHRHRDRHDLSGLPLEKCAGLPAVVVEGAPTGATEWSAFEGLDVAGAAVLVRTGWDAHFGTEGYGAPEHPFLSTEAAERLADAGAVLVGIDSVNIDDTRGRVRPVHTFLLDREIPVVEHLTGLDQLPPSGATFTAVRPRWPGCRRSQCGRSRPCPTDANLDLHRLTGLHEGVKRCKSPRPASEMGLHRKVGPQRWAKRCSPGTRPRRGPPTGICTALQTPTRGQSGANPSASPRSLRGQPVTLQPRLQGLCKRAGRPSAYDASDASEHDDEERS